MRADESNRVACEALEEAREIVRRELAGLPVEVYLFGSRATGTARASSDLDIGILPTGPVPADTLARLHETFEDSTIRYETAVERDALVSVDDAGIPPERPRPSPARHLTGCRRASRRRNRRARRRCRRER